MVIAHPWTPAKIEFQGKHRDEVFQFYFRQHWIRLLWPAGKLILFNVLITAAGVITFSALPTENSFTTLALTFYTLLFLFSQFEFLIRFYRYLMYVIVVTDKKIHRIKKTLFVVNDHQSIDLWMLQDIAKQQLGILQNLFGYGTIIFEAQETVLRIHFVPHVSRHYQEILHLREVARTRMSYMGGGTAGERTETSKIQKRFATPEFAKKGA